MTVTISLPAETSARLADRALATGKDVAMLIQEAIEEKLATPQSGPRADHVASVDVDGLLTEFFAANPEQLPPLPADFCRDDIYADHD